MEGTRVSFLLGERRKWNVTMPRLYEVDVIGDAIRCLVTGEDGWTLEYVWFMITVVLQEAGEVRVGLFMGRPTRGSVQADSIFL